MESWRNRGFVPDSDEEEDFDSQSSGRDAKRRRLNEDIGDGVLSRSEILAEEHREQSEDVEVNEDEPHPNPEKRASVERQSRGTSDASSGFSLHHIQESSPNVRQLKFQSLDESNRADRFNKQSPLPNSHDNETDTSSSDDELQCISGFAAQERTQSPLRKVEGEIALPNITANLRDGIAEPRPLSHILQLPADSITDNDDQDSLSSLSPPPPSLRLDDKSISDRDSQKVAGDVDNLALDENDPKSYLLELSQPSRRSFRQRNPIQLRPYFLEDARYRNQFKASGIKPVRVSHDIPTPKPKDQSQEREFINDREPPLSSPVAEDSIRPSSSAAPRRHSPKKSSLSRSKSTERSLDHDTDHRLKRVKFSYRKDKSVYQPQTTAALEVVIDNTPRMDRYQSTSVLQSLISPPRSGSTSSSQISHVSGFRFPRGFSPPNLTTPITDTKSRPQQSDDYAMVDWPQVDSERASPKQSFHNENINLDPESETELEAESVPEPAEIVEDEVKRLQRKIKGVLPASWLRLDLKHRGNEGLKATQRQRDSHAAESAEPVKGVARKIVRSSRTSLSSPAVRRAEAFSLDFSSSESEDGDNTKDQSALTEPNPVIGFQLPSGDLELEDDIPEDNGIDSTFPSITRASLSSHSPRGNKAKTYKARKQPRDNLFMRGSGPRKLQTRLTDTIPSQRKPKRSTPRAPKLGVLDAPDLAGLSWQDQPQFLRIAARKARSRRDRGRRSPGRKVFQMSTKNDTEDTNQTLLQWKKGGISQAKSAHSAHKPRKPARNPLSIRSENTTSPKRPRHPEPEVRSWQKDSSRKWIEDLDTDVEDDAINELPSVSDSKSKQSVNITTATSRVDRPPLPQNRWIVSRNYAISSLTRTAPRPAEFEVGSNHTRSPLLFNQSLAALNQRVKAGNQSHSDKTSFMLRRYLSDRNPAPPQLTGKGHSPVKTSPTTLNRQGSSDTVPDRRLKKRPPRRIDLDAHEHQLPSTMISNISNPRPIEKALHSTKVVQGLQTFSSSYSIDFAVVPLHVGTFFHQSTFIGSGEFARSLDVSKRNLDCDVGCALLQFDNDSFRWGQWKDTVSSELDRVFHWIGDEMESSNTDSTCTLTVEARMKSTLTSIIRYVTEKLSFADSVDRVAFVDKAIGLVAGLNERIVSCLVSPNANSRMCMGLQTFNLVFANQILQIASHDLVASPKRNDVLELVKDISRRMSHSILNTSGLMEIHAFLSENKQTIQREGGMRDNFLIVQAYVILYHVLRSNSALTTWFDEIVSTTLVSSFHGELRFVNNVQHLEQIWQALLSTLPLNEIDKFGIGRTGSRFTQPTGSWTTAKQLVQNVLEQEDELSQSHPAAYINYCRVMLHRCFHLLNYWGWRDCKVILETFFDFFAKNSLHNLKKEESFGSPSFLDSLDGEPQIEVQLGEPCFHIFLKIVATGLRFVSKTYDTKKTRNLAWRLLPNHGRVYPKDRPLQQEDLDALRNHHDLLCTLFWAVPDDCRPRLAAIRGLVDTNSSHQETLALSIRAWSRLVRFKLSTDEDPVSLEPFADWNATFVSDLIKQHTLARTEVESQTNGNVSFSKRLIESTISQNQRQIESLLNNALSNLNTSISSSRSTEDARILVKDLPLSKLLALFSAKSSRVNAVVTETLSVVISYLRKCWDQSCSSIRAADKDESQEYGDWTDIDMICDDVDTPPASNSSISYIEDSLHPVIFQFISNCFGEDSSPEDSILLHVIDCWSTIAHLLVNDKRQLWDSYIGPYGNYSWKTLRTTIQTKKFTPHFLACCIGKDNTFYADCRVEILGLWMSSLVERTSMLKFQHQLTACLLNEDPKNPLFYNLPFYQNRKDGRVDITLGEFSQRRLSLISSLLSNMREHLQKLEESGAPGITIMREEYRELIAVLMASMKENYQELGPAPESAQNDYVTFVHRTVEFLQQHVQNICPLDKFFTDPTSFPLPATDPTYIAARSKSYGIRLSSAKVAKQLVVFFQSVSERAALDGQQEYLVEQLSKCMSDEYERSNLEHPTLLSFFMHCVFPVYIENIFNNAAAWILGRPVLQCMICVFEGLLVNTDVTDPACTSSLSGIYCVMFRTVYRAIQLLIDHPGHLEEPAVLSTTTLIIRMVIAALPILDFLKRSCVLGTDILSSLKAIRDFAFFAASIICEPSMATDPRTSNELEMDNLMSGSSVPSFFNEVKAFAHRELQVWLRNSWSRHEGRYFIRRGGQSKEIDVTALLQQNDSDASLRGQQKNLLSSVLDLEKIIQLLDIFDEEDRCHADNSLYLYHATMKSDRDVDTINDDLAEMII